MSVEDLEGQLEAAYAAVQELDDDLAAGRISAAGHADLKQRSERQAAALLARLRQAQGEAGRAQDDARDAQGAARQPTTAARESRARTMRGATLGGWLRSPVGMTVGALVLVSAGTGLGVVLARSSGDTASAPAGMAPAGMSANPGGEAPRADARSVSVELEALRAEAQPDGAPTRTLLAFAHRALDEGQVPAAIEAYKRVLAREPKNVEAITHIAVILYQGNHVEAALKRIDEAIALDPKYAHAHWDRAQMLFNGKEDYPAAVTAIETFLSLVSTGDDAERARALLAEAKKHAAAPARAAAPAAPAPPARP